MLGRKAFIRQMALRHLIIVSLLGCSRLVLGQPPAPSPLGTNTAAPSSMSLEDGDRLLRAGDLNGALGVYRTVHKANPSRESQRRIAMTLDQLQRYGQAYLAYASLLDRYGSQLSADERRQAETRLRTLDELTGLLVLDDLAQAATLAVDGFAIAPEELARPLRVNRGVCQVEIQRPGFAPKSIKVTVSAGLQHLDATLAPLATTGSVSISATTPGEATLFVDGRAIGPLPQRVELPPGMHDITAVGPSLEARPVRVQIDAGKSMTLGLTIVEKSALFEIDPVAPDAILLVDKQAVGSGKRTITLTKGRHELELRRNGYQSQHLSIDARPGQQQHLRAANYIAAVAVPPPATPTTPAPNAAAQQEPAPAQSTPPAPESSPESPYRGIFGSFIVPIMLGGKSTHSYVDDCPAKSYGGACTTSAPRGGGLGLRLGYFYEWIGLELVGAGAVDVTTTELKLPPIPTISKAMLDAAGRSVFVRAGGMLGIGARLAIPMQGLRITVGADYLYVYRKVIAIPDSFAGASLSYSVPGWFIDGGIQLGSTPGARFYIGAFALIEQAHDLPLSRNLAAIGIDPTLVPPELTQMIVYRGRQVFFGPLLGIAFGH
jgi:hypothetical protein